MQAGGREAQEVRAAERFKRHDIESCWTPQIAQVTRCAICRACGMRSRAALRRDFAKARKDAGAVAGTISAFCGELKMTTHWPTPLRKSAQSRARAAQRSMRQLSRASYARSSGVAAR